MFYIITSLFVATCQNLAVSRGSGARTLAQRSRKVNPMMVATISSHHRPCIVRRPITNHLVLLLYEPDDRVRVKEIRELRLLKRALARSLEKAGIGFLSGGPYMLLCECELGSHICYSVNAMMRTSSGESDHT